ncbi:ribokinase [Hyphobacterium sp.]|uniref:ribokinase n=1 Tax=Hyphobacterium sp. TaxID=2004662 RepID=UPI003748D9F2
MSAPGITVIGSINLDLVAHCPKLPEPGETILGDDFSISPGGKGGNQALAARLLGAEVSFIGCIGADDHATAATALLRQAGVNMDQCRISTSHPTGVALIAVSADGENQIVVAPGANFALGEADIPPQIDTALIGQLEIPVPALTAAVDRCPGLKVLNLAPACELPDALLAQADLLIVNETEAAFYGQDKLLGFNKRVALTLGGEGAVMFHAGHEVARARPPKVDVLDTVGAGDAFVAAITLALLEGRGDQAALEFACVVGALATTKEGAQTGLPDRDAVETLLGKEGGQ